MSATATDTLRARLRDVEREVSEAREEMHGTRRAWEQARDAVARLNVPSDQLPRTAEFRALERARDERDAAQQRLEDLTEVQTALLRTFAGRQNGHGHKDPRGDECGDGWGRVARELSAGAMKVDLPFGDLVPEAAVTVTPSSGLTQPAVIAPFSALAHDERHVYQVFRREGLEVSDLGVSDYTQTGDRTVTGSIERDPVSSAEKAKLALAIELETISVRQLAVVIEKVPAKLLDAIPAFQRFLRDEAAYQVALALDTHCLAQLTAAKPPEALEGEALWQQVRNAVKAMRAKGARPTVLALDPDDAAALDLMTAGTDEMPVFPLGTIGGSSPLFGLEVIEVPTGLAAPTLVDPNILGVLYLGTATALLDPFTGMDTNEVRLRVEAEVLLHVRDVAGAHVIEKPKAEAARATDH